MAFWLYRQHLIPLLSTNLTTITLNVYIDRQTLKYGKQLSTTRLIQLQPEMGIYRDNLSAIIFYRLSLSLKTV